MMVGVTDEQVEEGGMKDNEEEQTTLSSIVDDLITGR